jgi:uncharacterized membrane protein YhaH (DUF805 family)
MRWSDIAAWGLIALLVIVTVVGVQFLVADPMRDTAKRTTWSHGYCAALGGEWLTVDVCNVDGKVVTIPEEG